MLVIRSFIFTIFLFSSLIGTTQSLEFTGTETGYFDSGELKYERYADSSGSYTGKWIDYAAPNLIQATIDFDRGIATAYYKETQQPKVHISFCSENLLNRQGGTYEEWWPNGQKKIEGYYSGRPRLFSGSSLSIRFFGEKEVINSYQEDGSIAVKKKYADDHFAYNQTSSAPAVVPFHELENLGGIYYWKKEVVPFNGKCEGTHSNGQRSFLTPVLNGKKIEAASQKWWETGAPKVEYISEPDSNVTIYYSPNGTVKRRIDHLAQVDYFYHDNGNLRHLAAIYEHRRVVFRELDPNGNILLEGQVEKGMQVGKWIKYQKDAKSEIVLKAEENYKDGYLQGPYKLYHPAGEVIESGQFEFGRKEGVWSFADSSGVIEETITYKFDEKHGQRTIFYPNGQPHYEMEYQREKLDGLLRIYDKSGSIQAGIQMKQNAIEEVVEQAEGYFLVSGIISHYFPHCGGAYGEGRTVLGGSIHVRSGSINETKKRVITSAVTLEAGRYFLLLKAGDYCFLEDRKLNRSVVDQYLQAEHGSFYKKPENDCYEEWFNRCDGFLSLRDSNILDFDFQRSDRCFVGDDPCLNYNGPYPP